MKSARVKLTSLVVVGVRVVDVFARVEHGATLKVRQTSRRAHGDVRIQTDCRSLEAKPVVLVHRSCGRDEHLVLHAVPHGMATA